MKYILLLLLPISSFCQQARMISDSSYVMPKDYMVLLAPWDSISCSSTKKYEPKYLYIKGDTVKNILELWSLHDKQHDILTETEDRLHAAENILYFITTKGQVTNWKGFYKATEKYKRIKNKKR